MTQNKKRKIEERPESGPTAEQIAERAYGLYLARGETPGHDVEDWLRAEAELRAEEGSEQAA